MNVRIIIFYFAQEPDTIKPMMKSLIIVLAVAGLAAGYSPFSRRPSSTEKTIQTGKNLIPEKPELSPVYHYNPNDNNDSGLSEVSEDEIPDGVPVYVMEESQPQKQKGESMSTADNMVFRPLFQYRNRQEALAKRRVANGYRRRYFVQRRPYRNAYNQYYHHRWY